MPNYCEFQLVVNNDGTPLLDSLNRKLYRCVNSECGKGPYPSPTGKFRVLCKVQSANEVISLPTIRAKTLKELPCRFRREKISTVKTDCCDGTRTVPVYICIKSDFKCCTVNPIGITSTQKIDGVLPQVCDSCKEREAGN